MITDNISVQINPTSGYTYPIIIGENLLSEAYKYISKYTKAGKFLIVTNTTVHKLYSDKINIPNSHFCILDDGEEYKNISSYERILNTAASIKLERNDAIITLGGGVVGDIAGFAAATYLRGIDFIQLPTTLLAQVDSSVGGKVGLNLQVGKNLTGAFYQPKLVLSDILTLKTLDERQIKTGLAEVVKYAFIEKNCSDIEFNFLEYLKNNVDEFYNKNTDVISKIIKISCTLKASVVNKDEKEAGLRAILNFGHTFAHSLESNTNYTFYTHGEAVSIGILMAFNLSLKLGLIDENYYNKALNLLNNYKLCDYSIPENISPDMLLNTMYSDKKVSNGKIKFVLPNNEKQAGFYNNVQNEDIIKILREYANK